jgi:CheY-like chemotaxis protein
MVSKSQPLLILLVEDHRDTLDVLERVLARRGHVVVTAASAAEALAVWPTQHFDAVISDIELPGMDGCELLRKLAPPPQCVTIALTACAFPQDVERTRAAGFTHHLVKPLGLEQLEAALLHRTQAADRQASAPTVTAPS